MPFLELSVQLTQSLDFPGMHSAVRGADDAAPIEYREENNDHRDINRTEYGRVHEALVDTGRAQAKHHRRYQHDVDERQRQHEFPAQRHQLVITEPRQRPPHPHEYEDEEQDLGEEYSDREQREPSAVRADVVA